MNRENTRLSSASVQAIVFADDVSLELQFHLDADDACIHVTVLTRQTNAPSPPRAGEPIGYRASPIRVGVRWHG